MPVYEYVCLDCKEKTEVSASLQEKEKGLQVKCGSCGSTNTNLYFGNMKVTAVFPLH